MTNRTTTVACRFTASMRRGRWTSALPTAHSTAWAGKLGGGVALWMVLATMACAVAAAAEPAAKSPPRDWPLVRGNAAGTGVYAGELPAELRVLWKYRVPQGMFTATPVIADGLVFLGDADGTFYAIELASGKEKWRNKAETSYTAGGAVSDGRVFVGDADGKIRCFDAASGKELWKHVTESAAEISGSPAFYKGRVLVGSQDGTLYALEVDSGKLVWKFTIDDQIRSTPTIIESRTFVAGCDSKFHILDLDTGQEVAAINIRDQTGSIPAAKGDRVYFRSQGGTVFAVEWKNAKIAWQTEDFGGGQQNKASVAVTDKLVLCAGNDRKVHALDLATGDVKWTFVGRGRIESSPLVAGNRVYVAGGDGRLHVLDLDNGKSLWHYEAGGSFVASPAAADGKLILANDDGVVFCFGPK